MRGVVPVTERWEFGGDSVIRPAGSVTILDGSTFCMAGPSGDVELGEVNGLFVEDTRVVSRWTLDIDGDRPELLRSFVLTPYHAVFVSRARPQRGRADSTLLVRRERFVGQGMREDIVVGSHAPDPTRIEVAVGVDADFADLFAVKEGRARLREGAPEQSDDGIRFEHNVGDRSRSVNVRAPGAYYRDGALRWNVTLPPRSEWRTTLHVGAHEAVDPDAWFPVDVPLEHTEQARRHSDWHWRRLRRRLHEHNRRRRRWRVDEHGPATDTDGRCRRRPPWPATHQAVTISVIASEAKIPSSRT